MNGISKLYLLASLASGPSLGPRAVASHSIVFCLNHQPDGRCEFTRMTFAATRECAG